MPAKKSSQDTQVTMRKCQRCGHSYELTEENFPSNGEGRELRYDCRNCRSEYNRGRRDGRKQAMNRFEEALTEIRPWVER